MMKVNKYLFLLIIFATSLQVKSGNFTDSLTYRVRLGYNLGGTAPIGMPATIRKLNKYTIQPNVTFAFDIYKPIQGNWGVITGLQFCNKGMNTDAKVKNYHLSMTRGGESLEGVFTGNVTTKVEQWMVTLPVQATYNLTSTLMLKFGPYVSYVLSHHFDGYAYNGYLREGNPTGQKVILGNEENSRGSYDFSGSLRRIQYGVDLGADWFFTKRWGAYCGLSWGLSGIFKSNFKTIEQTLYPIYGTIGITYSFK